MGVFAFRKSSCLFTLGKGKRLDINTKCNLAKYSTSPRKHADHYETLKIKRNASRRDIKHAYYGLSKKFHPDVNQNEGAEDHFKQIQEAYNVLGDERKKVEYDRELNNGYSYGGNYGSSSDGSVFRRGDFKRRTSGPIYTGRTKVYDFDEYYREHYGKNVKKAPNMGFYSWSAKSGGTNEEDLKNYWNRKEADMSSTHTDIRFKLLIRLAVMNSIFILFYLFFSSVKSRERDAIRKNVVRSSS